MHYLSQLCLNIALRVALICGIAAALSPGQPARASYVWKSVTIGGGGYVTGVVCHPKQRDLVYIRTDVSGAFRWDSVHNSWISLSDFFSDDDSGYYGIESLAVDPNNVNTVYIAVGKYIDDWSNKIGAIYKSTNQGNTWTKISPNWTVKCGGNNNRRWNGERLVVDPFNSKIILFGTRKDGLWKSSDGGGTWARGSFPGVPKDGIGILSIACDAAKSGMVYATAYGDSVYQSADHGATWTKIGGPRIAARLKAAGGVLWASTDTGVSKYSHGTWTNYLPPGKADEFSGISINPKDSSDIMAANSRGGWGTTIYRTKNGGASWTALKRTVTSAGGWFHDRMLDTPALAALEFDPMVPGRVWLTDWYATYHTDNIDAPTTAWSNNERGREALVTFALCSPPTGAPLVSGVADVEWFWHCKGLDNFPSTKQNLQDMHGIDYCPADPNSMIRVGFDRWQAKGGVATSKDGGATWTWLSSWNATKDSKPARVAVSAINADNFLVCLQKAGPRYTTDDGKSWSSVTGLPNFPDDDWTTSQPLSADRVTAGTFYYNNAGQFYKSTDGGANFTVVSSNLPASGFPNLKTVAGSAGEIWLSLDGHGLFHSSDGGSVFSKVSNIASAHLVATGKPALGSSIQALYIYGRLIHDTTDKIYRSLDRGATWTNIQDPKIPIGSEPGTMEGSQQTFGLVFIGTNGRGIYYGAPVAARSQSKRD